MFTIGAEKIRDEVILTARTLLVVLFLIFGWSKLADFDATVSYMAATGAPAPQLAAVIAIAMECFVSIAILFGAFMGLISLIRQKGFLGSARSVVQNVREGEPTRNALKMPFGPAFFCAYLVVSVGHLRHWEFL